MDCDNKAAVLDKCPSDLASSDRSESALATLLTKTFRKLRNICRAMLPWGRKALARVYFSLPVLCQSDPRRKLVSFVDHCCKVKSFPANDTLDSPDWYLKVRDTETIHRKMSMGLDEEEEAKFREGTVRYQFGNTLEIPPVFLSCVKKAKICSRDFLVLSLDDRILLESAFSDPDLLEKNGMLDTISRPRPIQRPGTYCLLASPWSNTHYYHWLLDALPRLSIIEQFAELKSVPLIVPGELKPFYRHSLEMASVAPERIVGFDGSCWQVDKLYFPELLSKTGSPSPHAVAWLREKFLVNLQKQPSPKRLLYVTRRDAPQRRVLNEDEVAAYLQSQGFEIVCPGALSFAEQISIFSQAKVVIGPHGAGFANMVFAPVNATLIEFFGDNYINGCFWALANVIGQKHAFLTSPAKSMDYCVSIERLNTLLQKVLTL